VLDKPVYESSEFSVASARSDTTIVVENEQNFSCVRFDTFFEILQIKHLSTFCFLLDVQLNIRSAIFFHLAALEHIYTIFEQISLYTHSSYLSDKSAFSHTCTSTYLKTLLTVAQ